MKIGDLVLLNSDTEEEKISLIICYEKKPLVGIVFYILNQAGLEWVYPEQIATVSRQSEERDLIKKET